MCQTTSIHSGETSKPPANLQVTLWIPFWLPISFIWASINIRPKNDLIRKLRYDQSDIPVPIRIKYKDNGTGRGCYRQNDHKIDSSFTNISFVRNYAPPLLGPRAIPYCPLHRPLHRPTPACNPHGIVLHLGPNPRLRPPHPDRPIVEQGYNAYLDPHKLWPRKYLTL